MFTEPNVTYTGLMAMLLAVIFYITSPASDTWRTKAIRESRARQVAILLATLVMFVSFACAYLGVPYAMGAAFFAAAVAIFCGAIDVIRFPHWTIGQL